MLRRSESSAPIIDKIYNVGPIHTGKFGSPSDYSASLNQMILPAIENFMDDLRASGEFGSQPLAPAT